MQIPKLLAAFAITFAAAAVGNLATGESIPNWYANLEKPFFTPPNAVFGPVWTALYTLMAISLYIVWTKRPAQSSRAYWWFAVQLVLNTLWSLVFFGAHQLWLGVAVIAVLIIAIVATIRAFWPVSRIAAYLLIPYLAWVAFACLLNLSVALLNS